MFFNRRTIRIVYSLMLSLGAVSPVFAEEPDWRVYDTLLKENVSLGQKNGVQLAQVNYSQLLSDKRFTQVYRTLSDFPLSRLQTRQEKLAFYINAYNILAIKMLLDHWPVQSIRDIGNWINPVWKKDAGRLGAKLVSLHEVEHEILRNMGEPRIHMAIVCASVSCPDLRNEAYRASQLESQLEDQTRRFLNNPKKGMSIKGSRVEVSKIFDWFEDDFDQSGGLESFLRRYHPTLPTNANINAGLTYDWEINSH